MEVRELELCVTLLQTLTSALVFSTVEYVVAEGTSILSTPKRISTNINSAILYFRAYAVWGYDIRVAIFLSISFLVCTRFNLTHGTRPSPVIFPSLIEVTYGRWETVAHHFDAPPCSTTHFLIHYIKYAVS